MSKIEAMYSCGICGVDKVKFKADERSEGENITDFVRRLAQKAGEDHLIRSPLCRSGKLYVYMPITKTGIGFIGEELSPEEKAAVARQLKGDDS